MAERAEGFPHYADAATGTWTWSPDGDWTGGFWVGQLWLLATHEAGDWAEHASRWASRLGPRTQSETIFRGFLFWYGAAIGARLTGTPGVADTALAGAEGLATLFNPRAGLIPLGREAEEASHVGLGAANIDGVPGTVPLLVWAGEQINRTELKQVAAAHTRTHEELCVRDDGSVCQSATFDRNTGKLVRRFTHKGSGDESTWTRAQAWAMLGFAHAAIWLDASYLPVLRHVADWWITHLPPDGVAYWDFDVPQSTPEPRDTSGTAIASAALLKLASLVPDGTRYRDCARHMVEQLVATFLTPVGRQDRRPTGILTGGCYNKRLALATNNELVWGDYFLLESLLVLAGRLDPLAV